MKKFQVTIQFSMDEDFMSIVPDHRKYIDSLIDKSIIDQYAVTMESQTIWITINGDSKTEIKEYLSASPLYKYWQRFEIDELVVLDGLLHRLPAVRLN